MMPQLDNPRHEKFAKLISDGLKGTEAYRQAYTYEGKQARTLACTLMKDIGITERISELREVSTDEGIANAREIKRFLTSCMRTPAGEVQEDSPLCQSVKITDTSREYKMPSKLGAAELLAKMNGDLEAKQGPTVAVNIAILGQVDGELARKV